MSREDIEDNITTIEAQIDAINCGRDTSDEFNIDELEEDLEYMVEQLDRLED